MHAFAGFGLRILGLFVFQVLSTFALYGWHAEYWGGVLSFEVALGLPLFGSLSLAPRLLHEVCPWKWAIVVGALILGATGAVLGLGLGIAIFGE